MKTPQDSQNLPGWRLALYCFVVHFFIIAITSNIFRGFLAVTIPEATLKSVFFGMGLGLVFDLSVAVFTFIPIIILMIVLPTRVYLKSVRGLVGVVLFAETSVFIFGLVCEFVFYGEFSDRFNFIAVDYLVYTHEVIGNIWESYPVLWIFAGVFALAGAIAFAIVSRLPWPRAVRFPLQMRAAVAASVVVLVVLFDAVVSEQTVLKVANPFEELVAKNGLFALFTAYRMNEINFDRFYTKMDSKEGVEHVHELLEGSYETKENHDSEDETSIVRNFSPGRPPKKLNVVLVVMESMSARYMGYYGSLENVTPNLDRLTQESIFFDRLYATGTRTVRGLEAILLAIPPTPGQSIVRRPAGTNVFNLGTVFQKSGYQTNFIYGGRSSFDSMKEFFEGNRFTVHDQTTFESKEIEFSNAWGVSDVDLFKQVVKESDSSFAKTEPFFHVVLTTSNHRPYTFPNGKVERKPGSRFSAIQYSDYAIGEFLKEAGTKPWFDSTVFIFMADHNAAVSGGTKIHPEDYLVPLIMYSPGNLKPQIVNKLSSQIDLAPTLMGLLDMTYQSRFFGMDLMREDPDRAFISTYQKVGYLTKDALTILSPIKQVESYSWINGKVELVSKTREDAITSKTLEPLLSTVAYYQVASDWFRGKLLETDHPFKQDVNIRQ